MEEATITNATKASGKMPMLITTDDLVMEIGRLYVERMNNGLIVNKASERVEAVLKRVGELEKQAVSVQAYADNNKRLDARIVELNQEIKTLKKAAENGKHTTSPKRRRSKSSHA